MTRDALYNDASRRHTVPPPPTYQSLADLAEIIAESALLGRSEANTQKIPCLTAAWTSARQQARPGIIARFDARHREILRAHRRSDYPKLAFAAAELVRLAYREIPAGERDVPLQVFLLNYAGLKLAALAQQTPADWNAIDAVAFEVAAYWNRFDPVIRDHHLHELIERVTHLLVSAVAHHEPRKITLAARRLHAIAHLVEHYLESRRYGH